MIELGFKSKLRRFFGLPLKQIYESKGAVTVKDRIPVVLCSSCLETNGYMNQLDCQHTYCHDCLRRICNLSLLDKSLIPIRCCKIPLGESAISNCLSSKDMIKYKTFLRDTAQNVVPLVEELDQIMAGVIENNGWKVCKECGAVIEKIDGCYYVKCKCGFDFCYICRKPIQWCRCR
jgi:hypothetical protein